MHICITAAEANELRSVLKQIEIDYRHAAGRLLDDDAATNGIRFIRNMLFEREAI